MEWLPLIVIASFCRNIRVILYCEMGSKRCIKGIF